MPWARGAVVDLLLETSEFIAVDKPEGIPAIPDRRRTSPSLLERLSAERQEQLYVVHRLDRETSGVILFARSPEAHRWLNRQFEARTVRKLYLALVHGTVEAERGEIDRPLRQFGSGRVAVDPERGKPSTTEFAVARKLGAFTLLEVYPHTGRRHQIRVHLFSIGHPIVGDPLYGDRAVQNRYGRLMLHARRLTMPQPGGEDLAVESPVPPSFLLGLEAVGPR